MSALALIPIALAFTWLALEKRRPWAVALAAVFSAGVVSNNFYGATALAVFYPILVWSFWITRQDKRIRIPAIAIPRARLRPDGLLAGALVLQGHGGKHEVRFRARHHLVHLGGRGGGRRVRRVHDWLARKTTRAHLGGIRRRLRGLLLAQRAGQLLFQFPHRAASPPPAARARHDLHHRRRAGAAMDVEPPRHRAARGSPVVMVLPLSTPPAATSAMPGTCSRSGRITRTASSTGSPTGSGRTCPTRASMPSGSVRFWFDAWHDLAQMGGGSDQGLLNGQVEPAQWEINLGPEPQPAILWMQCLGVDAVYVSDKSSQEIFKDFQSIPKSTPAYCPCSSTISRATCSTACPRRYPARARVVETASAERRASRRASMTTWSICRPTPTSSKRVPTRRPP